jgi:hypothetical protein
MQRVGASGQRNVSVQSEKSQQVIRSPLGGRLTDDRDSDEMKLSANMPGMLLIAASMIGFFYVYLCLRDGVVLNRGIVINRQTRARLYWLLIVLYVLFSLATLLMGFDTLGSEVVAA